MGTEQIIGYVICADEIAKPTNPTFAGTKRKTYLGQDYSFLGFPGFKPYKSAQSANNAKETWEKRFQHPAFSFGWTYIIGDVMPLYEWNLKELSLKIEKQIEQDVLKSDLFI